MGAVGGKGKVEGEVVWTVVRLWDWWSGITVEGVVEAVQYSLK